MSTPDCATGWRQPRSTSSRFLQRGFHAGGDWEERWKFCIRIAPALMFTRTASSGVSPIWPTSRRQEGHRRGRRFDPDGDLPHAERRNPLRRSRRRPLRQAGKGRASAASRRAPTEPGFRRPTHASRGRSMNPEPLSQCRSGRNAAVIDRQTAARPRSTPDRCFVLGVEAKLGRAK